MNSSKCVTGGLCALSKVSAPGISSANAGRALIPIRAEFVGPTKRLNGATVHNAGVLIQQDPTSGAMVIAVNVGNREARLMFSANQAKAFAAVVGMLAKVQ